MHLIKVIMPITIKSCADTVQPSGFLKQSKCVIVLIFLLSSRCQKSGASRSWKPRPGSGLLLGPQLLHTFLDDRFITALDRLVITTVLRQIRLVHPAAFKIMAVLIFVAVTELLGAWVVRIAQVRGDGQ